MKQLSGALSDMNPALIYGTQQDRDGEIARFQRDGTRVIIVMIQAGGVAISLHDLNGTYPRVALIMPHHRAEYFKQGLGRIWRAGAKSKAIQKIVLASGTTEERVYAAMKRKIGNLDTLNDSDMAGVL